MKQAKSKFIYLDNAATSWPKAPGLAAALTEALQMGLANPGRGSHRLSIAAGRQILAARQELAALFHCADPLRVIFTANVTEAINLVLLGWLRPGERVVTTGMEHNAVMRPLRFLEQELGLHVAVVPADASGVVSLEGFAVALTKPAALAVVNHASNVVGTIQPLREIGQLCRAQGVPLLVDAAQTAGALPVDMTECGADFLAFTGHKSLLGPTGTGGLCLGGGVDLQRLQPLLRGGTGSLSEHETQPDFLPDRYESGTLNTMGIIGLLAALRYLQAESIGRIRTHEQKLTAEMLSGLQDIPGVTVYGTGDAAKQVGVVSFNINGMDGAEVAFHLDDEYGIMCRVGLHCSPAAHRSIGTFPQGTVRFGLGYFNDEADVAAALEAVSTLAKRKCPLNGRRGRMARAV